MPRTSRLPSSPVGACTPSLPTTRTSIPSSGLPSVSNTLSGGSSRWVVVTPPFSVIPQHEMTNTPSRSLARWTRTRGIGAPAVRKVCSEFRSHSSTAGLFVRSERNGVEAMVNVTPSSEMICTALSGFQTSIRTARPPSIIGIITP